MVMQHPLLLALIALAPALACAQERYSPRFKSCMDKAAGVTASMIECITAETRAQDVRHNDNYKALQATLAPARKAELLEAQRAWIRYRDLNCRFHADPDGGSLARVLGNECVLKATAERASELKGMTP